MATRQRLQARGRVSVLLWRKRTLAVDELSLYYTVRHAVLVRFDKFVALKVLRFFCIEHHLGSIGNCGEQRVLSACETGTRPVD